MIILSHCTVDLIYLCLRHRLVFLDLIYWRFLDDGDLIFVTYQ